MCLRGAHKRIIIWFAAPVEIRAVSELGSELSVYFKPNVKPGELVSLKEEIESGGVVVRRNRQESLQHIFFKFSI
jgi:hypothetical protein